MIYWYLSVKAITEEQSPDVEKNVRLTSVACSSLLKINFVLSFVSDKSLDCDLLNHFFSYRGQRLTGNLRKDLMGVRASSPDYTDILIFLIPRNGGIEGPAVNHD